MTIEELKKEAEESFEKYRVTDIDYVVSPYSEDEGEKMLMFNREYDAEEEYFRLYSKGYLASAEPREKRIEELRAICNIWFEHLKDREAELLTELNNQKAKYNRQIKELEKENAELRKIAEFQQSSNMNTHLENKKLKEGLAIGSTFNKTLNSMNKNLEEERDKYRNMVFDKDEQLTKAKEILKAVVDFYPTTTATILCEAEKFISEVEK